MVYIRGVGGREYNQNLQIIRFLTLVKKKEALLLPFIPTFRGKDPVMVTDCVFHTVTLLFFFSDT